MMVLNWTTLAEIGFALSLVANALFFIPQAYKLFRTKSAENISPITFLGFNIIQAFTAIHAYIIGDRLLFWGSVAALLTCGAVSFFALKYSR